MESVARPAKLYEMRRQVRAQKRPKRRGVCCHGDTLREWAPGHVVGKQRFGLSIPRLWYAINGIDKRGENQDCKWSSELDALFVWKHPTLAAKFIYKGKTFTA